MREQRERAYEYLSRALDIGERMLVSGAEVNRVEDTITRICRAYGAEHVDVFTITSSIVVTLRGRQFGTITETRRIQGQGYDLSRLDCLNQLSRFICGALPPMERIGTELEKIDGMPTYRMITQMFIYGMISAAFTIFFGGTGQDAMASALIGVMIRLMEEPMRRMGISKIFSCFLSAVVSGLLAALSVHTGAADNADMISIGNIMLLIPGIALTNSIRDLFQGDTITGLARFAEAILLANIVVLGVSIAAMLVS